MELHPRDGSSSAVRSLAGWYERVDTPVVRREVPGGRIVLVISFGPPLEVDGSSYGSFVAGLHDRAAITEHAGVSHGVHPHSPLHRRRGRHGFPRARLVVRDVRPVCHVAARLLQIVARMTARPAHPTLSPRGYAYFSYGTWRFS